MLYQKYGIDYRSQKRRVLTFALDDSVVLPPDTSVTPAEPAPTANYHEDPAASKRGEKTYALYCAVCHGVAVVAGGHAPDLRRSSVPSEYEPFKAIVQSGALVPNGMPRFDEFTDEQLRDLRQYIETQSNAAAAH